MADFGAETPGEEIDALKSILVLEEGFMGNEEDYYRPANSLLHEVLRTRRGIPISLSAVWLDVAEQNGRRGIAGALYHQAHNPRR